MSSARASTEHALRELQAQARYVFTPAEFAQLSGRTMEGTAVTAALARLAADKRIVLALKRPTKWLIVPPEHAHYGAPPASWWLHDYLQDVEPNYYLALLSAARHWGSAHYALQTIQVMVGRHRLNRTVGKLRIEFTVKSTLSRTPVVLTTAQGAKLRVSTREATLLDLIRHQHVVGGLEAVARIARDFRKELQPQALRTALDALDQSAAAQRLGLIFEVQGQADAARVVEEWLRTRPLLTVPLGFGEADVHSRDRGTCRPWRVSYSAAQRDQLEGLA